MSTTPASPPDDALASTGKLSGDADEQALARLVTLLEGRRFVVLTGAGCSTDSGIPDYRGEGRTGPRNPIQHAAFLRDSAVRRRYWARATLGWSWFSSAQPNAAHRALAALEQAGPLEGVITQNVDRLHHHAGSRRVIELHGALADVLCLSCSAAESRQDVQERLLEANPGWLERIGEVRPDGDADLSDEVVATFRPVGCRHCDGDLKPDVVFFGGTVSERTLSAAWALFDRAEALLVVGSSLTVYSGFRFARRSADRGLPIGIVNLGPTRADDLAEAKVSASVARVLPRLARALGA